ncbi:Putative NADH-flavin reductase [Serratia grimesii]|uniref:SDR family oxidoreductase n=1 Tax=Serratia grimesii TaxID=82995 RepID=UPI00217AA51A|nr:SDR family oxidoreductase [Serratia grimesii]CAI0926935.1 Putative NADH-flavin reductase [Serratia grimesii]CAI2785523.1 Putative NADH-flavin reductase [Serratia grimesii]
MTPQRILVLGASGYIGQNLIPHLIEQGHDITAAARRIEWLQEQHWPHVNCQYVDVYQPDTLAAALWEIDAVYYLIHGMGDGDDFIEKERQAAENLRDALRSSNVKQVIFLGALQPAGESSPHLVARKLTGEILRQSGIPITELRASIIVGPGSAAFEIMRDMVYNLPILTPPRWVRSKSSPVALENLLVYLADLLEHPAEENRIFDVAGPEYISYQTMFERFIAISGKKRWLIPIPLPTRFISVWFISMITSVPTSIASALIQGLNHDLPADGKPIQALIPQRLQTFDQAVTATLKREEDVVDSADWGYDPEARARWRPGYGFYPKQAGCSLETSASSQALWHTVQQLGGKEGYFYANILWQIRARMDDMIGNRVVYGRPERDTLAVGDLVDGWKVITIKPQRLLALLFGMKAPGLGRLAFTIKDHGDYRTLDVRAWWHPAGFSGLLYWFAMMPAHLFIFRGMARRIARLAEEHQRTLP